MVHHKDPTYRLTDTNFVTGESKLLICTAPTNVTPFEIAEAWSLLRPTALQSSKRKKPGPFGVIFFWFEQKKKTSDRNALKLTAIFFFFNPAARVPANSDSHICYLHRRSKQNSTLSNFYALWSTNNDWSTATPHLAADYDPSVILRRVSSDLRRRERPDVLQLGPGISERESRVQGDVQSFLRTRTQNTSKQKRAVSLTFSRHKVSMGYNVQ